MGFLSTMADSDQAFQLQRLTKIVTTRMKRKFMATYTIYDIHVRYTRIGQCIDERGSKIAIKSVFDFHLSPMSFEN